MIRKSLNEGNREFAASILHMIKGTAGNIGANKLYNSAKALELGIKKSRTLSESLIMDFDTALVEVLEATNVFSSENPPPLVDPTPSPASNSTITRSEIGFMLSKLKRLLEKNSFSAESYLHSIIDHLEAPYNADARQVLNHINRLDYTHAKTELESLAEKMKIPME
jgi:hypothetical protein